MFLSSGVFQKSPKASAQVIPGRKSHRQPELQPRVGFLLSSIALPDTYILTLPFLFYKRFFLVRALATGAATSTLSTLVLKGEPQLFRWAWQGREGTSAESPPKVPETSKGLWWLITKPICGMTPARRLQHPDLRELAAGKGWIKGESTMWISLEGFQLRCGGLLQRVVVKLFSVEDATFGREPG